jgi:hypothetical protein
MIESGCEEHSGRVAERRREKKNEDEERAHSDRDNICYK